MSSPDMFGERAFWPALHPVRPIPPRRVPLVVKDTPKVTSRRVPQTPRPVVRPLLVKGRARIPAEPPGWAQTPPAPLTLARQGLARVKAAEEGAARTAALAATAYAAWWIASTPRTAALLWLAAVGYGLSVAWTCHGGAAPWRWTRTRAVIATAAVSVCGLILLLTGHPVLTSVLAVAAAQGFAHRPDGVKSTGKWSHDRIARALLAAKVLPKPADADLPTLHYLGRPGRVDDHGNEWGTINLPPGTTYDQVRKRHDELASALDMPADRLHLEHDRNQPASAVTMALLAPRDLAPAVAVLPNRTDWNQPVPLGPDRLGRPTVLRTRNTHTAWVGTTGSGKTRGARYQASHAILDPNVPLACLSFKDDEEDWSLMRPMCQGRYVSGTSRASLERAVELLTEIEAVSEYRGSLPRARRQPMIVVVDEWARALKAAARYDRDGDGKLALTLGSLFAELAATVRSREIHLITTWQRGTVTYIDGDLRANLPQKCVGMTVKKAETHYVLDVVPQALPEAPGEMLVNVDDGEPTLVRLPDLDDDGFADVCRRGALLREAEPHGPLIPPIRVEMPAPDPFAGAVRRILEVGPMTPTALRESLPVGLRGTSPRALAARLASVGDVEAGWGGEGGKRRVYRLVSRRDDASRALDAAFHAQTGSGSPDLSEASALP